MSRLITALQATSARVAVMFLMTVALLRERVGALRTQPERGGGMTTLEMVLLGVAGVAAAGVVIAAIASSIGDTVDDLP